MYLQLFAYEWPGNVRELENMLEHRHMTALRINSSEYRLGPEPARTAGAPLAGDRERPTRPVFGRL